MLTILSVVVPGSLAGAQVETEGSTLSVTTISADVLNILQYNLNEAIDPKSIAIHGEGFVNGSKVVFQQTFPNGTIYTITPTDEKIRFANPTRLTLLTPLSLWVNPEGNVVNGTWKVIVTNPDGHKATSEEDLEVTTYRGLTRQQIEDRDSDPLTTCIIATAAYGSEMAPEVQFLRGFRDHTVRSTFVGSSFMDAFNSFYYSWSPGVADSIRDVEEAKAFTRGMIVPLIGVLSVSSSVYDLVSFSPELAVILAGVVASSMLGAIYFTLPMIGILRFVSPSKRIVIIRRGTIALLGVSATGFAITSVAVFSSSSFLAMFGSGTLVLSSMFAAALIVSSIVLAIARPTYLRISSMRNVSSSA